jgi:hypothetical protein
MSKCIGCGFPVTWEHQRRQWGRLMRRGLSREEAKNLMPRCQKCMTLALRTVGGIGEVGDPGMPTYSPLSSEI